MSGSTAADLKPGDKIGLAYDLGDLDFPKYGSMKNVRGIIPFLLPYGEYQSPPILKEPERLAKFARGLRIQFASVFENELDEEIEAKIRDYSLIIAQVNPTEDIETERMRALAIASIMVFFGDDVLDDLGSSADSFDMGYESGYAASIMFDLMTKKYKSVDEVSSLVPALTPFYALAIGFMDACDDAVPNFRARDEQTRIERMRAFNSVLLVGEKDFKMNGFSDSVSTNLCGLQSAIVPVLEYIANMYDFNVGQDIRNDIVFQIFVQAIANASNLINSLIGLGRDLKLDQVEGSVFLGQIVYKGKSLEEAYRYSVDLLLDNMNDIRLAAKKLRGRFKVNPLVDKYVRAGEFLMDGQFMWYTTVARYGKYNLRVEKISE